MNCAFDAQRGRICTQRRCLYKLRLALLAHSLSVLLFRSQCDEWIIDMRYRSVVFTLEAHTASPSLFRNNCHERERRGKRKRRMPLKNEQRCKSIRCRDCIMNVCMCSSVAVANVIYWNQSNNFCHSHCLLPCGCLSNRSEIKMPKGETYSLFRSHPRSMQS